MTRPARLFFLHIPKTAGSVVHNVLHRNYRERDQLEINFYLKQNPIQDKSESELRNLKLVRGHFPFNIHTAFPPGTFEYCTLLREPLDRCISHYHYMLARQKNTARPDNRQLNNTLEELCSNGKQMFVDNLQVRMLSGMYDVPFGEVSTDMVDIAWKNLNAHFPVIGIQSQFNAFVLQLADRYDLRFPYYQYQRVNKSRPTLAETDVHTRVAVLHRNRFDVELYNRAEQLVNARIKAEGSAFESRLNRFSRNNTTLSRILNAVPFLFRKKDLTD